MMMMIIIINGEMRSNEKPRTPSALEVTAMSNSKNAIHSQSNIPNPKYNKKIQS